jgi:hypothetical protein
MFCGMIVFWGKKINMTQSGHTKIIYNFKKTRFPKEDNSRDSNNRKGECMNEWTKNGR